MTSAEPPIAEVPDGPPGRSLAQTVFRHGAVYAIAGLVSQGVAFFLFPFFAHQFSPADYGVLDLLTVIMVLANLTIALEVMQGLGRFYATAGSDGERRRLASTAFTFSLLCNAAFSILVFAFAGPLTRLALGDDVDPTIVRIAAGVFLANGLTSMATDLLRWQLRPIAFAAAAILNAVTITVASAVLVLGFDLGVEGAVLGQLIGMVVGGTLAFWLGRDQFRLRIDRVELRRMLAYSLPLVPASTGVFFNGYADRVAIQAQLDLGEVGIYGVAYRLSVIVSLTLVGFQGALLPQVLRHHDQENTPKDLARVFRLFCALALTITVAISSFGDELIRILTPPAYYRAEEVVPFVVAAAFLAGMFMFAPGLSIARRTRTYATATVAGGVANLVLALALVKPLGIQGAALAFLVTEAATFGTLMVLSQRHYPVPHQWRRLLVGAAMGALLTFAGWRLPAVEDDLWSLPVKLAICVAAIGALGVWLVDRDERQMGAGVLRTLSRRVRRPAAPS